MAFTTSLSIERISLIILLFLSVLLLLVENSSGEGTSTEDELGEATDEEGHVSHPAHAVLFPSFILVIGVVVYYILSRFLHFLPYTAIMFLLGTVMGIFSASDVLKFSDKGEHYMHDTLFAWQNINSEVLLLVFLPGLIFKDALGQNPYLFTMGFGQLFIFAFPLVLAGTVLTACIGYYIFPYDWSFPLCLVFGSILSATDPVAVAALLEEVGAPPRLKTHVAGESLLNDGAAIVFFFIFLEMFVNEFGIPGFGESIDFAEGVRLFCQKALGGAAIGLMFGGGIILCLSYLNRKFGREENIVQVTAVLGMVYLNYFVADLVCATSGVIATVAAGLTVKLFGRGSINNISLMDDFFSITEHILNTILFTLGGLVWGAEIVRNHNSLLWSGTDWGYLILLYVLLHVIRACLFVSVYPITSRIGLSTTWPETLFQIYGGLRGAVGLALAIALENETSVRTDDVYPLTDQNNWVSQVYQMVGGVALLTLVINGSTAGPVLIWLGLADSSEAREKIIKSYRVLLRAEMIESLVELLTHERFKHIDFAFVNKQIPLMSDLDLAQLAEFVEHLKDITPSDKYCPPYLGNIVSHLKLKDGVTDEEMELRSFDILREDPIAHARKMRIEKRKRGRQSTTRSSMVAMMADNPLSTKELRLLFISMLRAQYEKQLDEGLLTSQHGMTVALQQSLEEAEVHVSNGGQLNDLHYLQKFHNFSLKLNKYFTKASCGSFRRSKKNSVDDMILKGWVLQEMAFTTAHERAQEFFQEQLGESDKELSEAGKIVVAESKRQMKEVADDLNRHVVGEFVIRVSTHKCCEILLTKGIKYIESLSNNGLLKDSETEEMVEEMVHLLNETKEAAVDVEGKKDILLDLNQYLSSRDLNLDGHGKKDIARDLNLSTIGEAEDKNPVMNVDKGEDEEGPVMNVEEA